MNQQVAGKHMHSALLTDLYQITMANGYWKLGMAERRATFHLFHRKNPFAGHYAVACGLAQAIDYIQNYQFTSEDIDYLKTLTGANNQRLFDDDFLDHLKDLRIQCDIDAVPEGTLIFPHEPIVRVSGPLLHCQLLETALINHINFATLIATKASRVTQAAQDDVISEFGLRRAQGPNGGVTASRAAYIGGCHSTSNLLAGKLFDIPVVGTVAHSWIMSFDKELDSFNGYLSVMPHNSVLLVDTYQTESGVQYAIQAGKKLRQQGYELMGIRLDSGDLNQLSHIARNMLDQAGFTDTKIVASGDLEEHLITELKSLGAPIDIWGVGTKLSTAYDQPSLDAAYKLSAIEDENGTLHYKCKRSDTPAKTTNPGILQVRRYWRENQMLGDCIFNVDSVIQGQPYNADHAQDLLVPIFRHGKLCYDQPSIHDSRQFCIDNVNGFMRLANYQNYPVQLEQQLQELKSQLLAQEH